MTYCLTIYNTRGNVVSWQHCSTLDSLRFAFSMARRQYRYTRYRFAVEVYFGGSCLLSLDFSQRIKNVSMTRFAALASSLRLTALKNINYGREQQQKSVD